MKRTKILLIFVTGIFIIISSLYFINLPEENQNQLSENTIEEGSSSSNIIENVEYSSKDSNGNKYTIKAKQGEVDLNRNDVIFLKEVSAEIILTNQKKIIISADFGKYNINNFDTIFSKNVKMNYLENQITSEYLDFSILRNSMIISNNVIYMSPENTLKTDVIEINIETKDTKFYMYKKNNKVKIINQN